MLHLLFQNQDLHTYKVAQNHVMPVIVFEHYHFSAVHNTEEYD